MGRFGFGQSANPCLQESTGRRLAPHGTIHSARGSALADQDGQSGSPRFADSADGESLPQRLLVVAMVDTLTALSIIIGSVFLLHLLLEEQEPARGGQRCALQNEPEDARARPEARQGHRAARGAPLECT